MPCVEVGCLRTQKEQRARQVARLAESSEWHPRQKTLPCCRGLLVVFEHPCRQRRAKYRWRNRVDRDGVLAPFATQRSRDAIYRGLGGTVGCVTCRVTQQSPRRGSQHHFPTASLLNHLRSRRTRNEP